MADEGEVDTTGWHQKDKEHWKTFIAYGMRELFEHPNEKDIVKVAERNRARMARQERNAQMIVAANKEAEARQERQAMLAKMVEAAENELKKVKGAGNVHGTALALAAVAASKLPRIC
mmetsp:Transcript_36905/g.61151  ORF Transcript_36905/g.61151 Transcript_36905/m.61151 type:complete len:118 (+) Transcript_36905:87-440(+)|eukprot:CAMPEP_0119322154 /NCGR_PEP_ID=MMETSP1333-20130426/57420_1 /TAXON_ID=418940 /ORGANISM="Scyphosphaera apsteinii, Strain RCC1455" /LENGTH=117 /DNA_ID=CAMNT_0007329305 /DNA_START=81 /DNA_END=434 /DNA_ORIENTATION=-